MIYTMSSGEAETRIKILDATWRLMIEKRGQGVRMSDIAAAAGVSRQALYLHFASRTDLLIATTHYGDKLNRMSERLQPWLAATTGLDALSAVADFWGNYIPDIYGIAKALLINRETDADADAAWNERMEAVRGSCRRTVEMLEADGKLTPELSVEDATNLMWTMLSIQGWEQLTVECGWTTEQYVERMKTSLNKILVRAE
jgi:AcrR family transcriptional regulator